MTKDGEPKKQKFSASGIVTALIFFAILLGVIALTVDFDSPGEFWFYVIFFVVTVGLGVLSASFKQIGTVIDSLFGTYLRFTVWCVITILPIVAVNWLAQILVSRSSLALQIAVFVLWGLVLAVAIRLIITEKSRAWLFQREQKEDEQGAPGVIHRAIEALRKRWNDLAASNTLVALISHLVKSLSEWLGKVTPFVYAFDLLVVAAMFFSSVTFVLVQHNVVALSLPTGASPSYSDLLNFYVWHFLEAVPLLKVNDTLQWKAPMTYQAGWIGGILLLFKIAVILPVITAFAWYWKRASEKDKQST